MMKIVEILPYNTEIKITGNIVTMKSYTQKQLAGYVVKKSGGGNDQLNKLNIDVLIKEFEKGFYNYSIKKEIINKLDYMYSEMVAGLKNYSIKFQTQKKYFILNDDTEKRERFVRSCYRAKANIFDLVACNVNKHLDYEGKKVTTKFLTLTFKENITDLAVANMEVTKFFKRLSYELYKVNKNVIKYITVPELQNRGAWHFHIILFNMKYIRWTKLIETWGIGGVYINALGGKMDSTTVAKYITKYISKGITVKEGKKNTDINRGEENRGDKNLSDYNIYKLYNMENKKRYNTSRGLYKPFKAKLETIQAEREEIYHYLIDSVATRKKINDKGEEIEEKGLYYKKYTNEFRGDIEVLVFEIKDKHKLKELKKYIKGIYKHNREMNSHNIKYNWGKVDAIRRRNKDDWYLYELEKQYKQGVYA